MTTSWKRCIPIVLAGLSCNGFAAVVATDNFDSYTAGVAVNGLNGGAGWTTAWSTPGATTVEVSSETLSYSSDGGTYGGGNSIMLTGDSDVNAAFRSVTVDTSGQDYYASFVFKIEGPTGTETGNVEPLHGFTLAALGSNNAYDGNGSMGFLNPGSPRIEARNGGQYSTLDIGALQYSTTYLMVVKYTGWDAVDGVYETTQVWLNPSESDEFSVDPTITVSATSDGTGSDQYGGVGMRFLNSGAGGDHKLYMDDLRIGTSWSSVAIPEPGASSFLLSIAVVGLIAISRRRMQ
ncbi:MAG: hypothetical protein ACQKBT_01020 [Puniceicoccales bacterium]